MRHFPLDGTPYAMSLGVRPLLAEPRLEFDADQIALKKRLLDAERHGIGGTVQGKMAHRLELG